MNIERRFSPLALAPVQLRAEGETQKIDGYAAVTWDGSERTEYVLWESSSERAVERIMPGAFTLALSRPDDVRALFNHDPNMILGRASAGTMRLSLDGKGLRYEIDPNETTVSKDVRENLRLKNVTGSSFAFYPDEVRWIDTKKDDKWFSVREVLSVTLYDVGPVTFPAYDATTAGIRAADGLELVQRSLATFRQTQKGNEELRQRLAAIRERARLIA